MKWNCFVSEIFLKASAASSTWNVLVFCRDILGEQPVRNLGGIIFIECPSSSTVGDSMCAVTCWTRNNVEMMVQIEQAVRKMRCTSTSMNVKHELFSLRVQIVARIVQNVLARGQSETHEDSNLCYCWRSQAHREGSMQRKHHCSEG